MSCSLRDEGKDQSQPYVCWTGQPSSRHKWLVSEADTGEILLNISSSSIAAVVSALGSPFKDR